MVLALTPLLAPAPSFAQAPHDSWTDAKPLTLDIQVNDVSNVAATDHGGGGEPVVCDGNTMEATIWFSFTGDGLSTTITTAGSTPFNQPLETKKMDTILAVYRRPAPGEGGPGRMPFLSHREACNDDANFAAGDFLSAVTIPTVAGREYLVQVGGCSGCGSNSQPRGDIDMVAFTRPVNDALANPIGLSVGGTSSHDNFWATATDANERTDCGGPYGRTVWFAFDAPAHGTATFVVQSGFSAVVAVSRDGAPVGCGRTSGANAVAQVAVAAGRYLVQVGGADGVHGPFTVSTSFVQNFDLDGDKENGRPVGNDCNDANPAINSAAVDIYDNGVDENCDDSDAPNPDRDGDGIPNADDCQPLNPRVYPGAVDIPENGVNEDCKLGDAQFGVLPTSPRAFFVPTGGGFAVTSLALRDVPKGARVELRCTATRGCTTKRKLINRSLKRKRNSMRLPRITRGTLPRGSVVEIRVSKPGFVGRIFKWGPKMRQRLPVFTELCVKPGQRKPFKCR